jgi:hypothetical protein
MTRSWEEVKRIKSCGVYLFPDMIYVVASARTVPGFDIHSEPVFKMERGAQASVLGEKVIAALNAFRFDVPPPGPGSKDVGPLLKQTGLRSWKQLEARALHISVTLDGEIIRVIPTARDLRHGGYNFKPDLTCECVLDRQEIGTTLLQALEKCS